MGQSKLSKRDSSLDVLRIVAMCSVICVHFFSTMDIIMRLFPERKCTL